MRILLAEDAALLREGLVALLERGGHEVVGVAATATELTSLARPLLADGRVDLLLTDVRMPPGGTDDGLRAALEQRTAHPALPLVVLSQYVEQSFARTLLEGGAAGIGYLLKDRVTRVHDFLGALETVRGGGTVLDPEVVGSLLRRRPDRLSALTAREREVLAVISQGATNQQAATRLHLSEGAIVKHTSAVFDKLGLSEREGNRRVLAVLAYLGSPPDA